MSRLTASISERNESPALPNDHAYARPVPVPFEDDDREEAHAEAASPPHNAFARPPAGGAPEAALPLLATAGDVREVVQYLKKRPGGVSVVEAMEDTRRRVFEPRKVAAYEFWGIVERTRGDRLRLTALGWEFARKFAPQAEAYRAVLHNTESYRAALAWVYEQGLEVVTHAQVAEYWRAHGGAHVTSGGDKTLEGSVVCFFHLCQAAELGTVTLGKRGQPARLRVEREELSRHVGGGARPSWPPAVAAHEAERQRPPADPPPAHAAGSGLALFQLARRVSERPRLYISSRAGAQAVGRLRVVLDLAEVGSLAVERGDVRDAPVGDEALRAMRRCDAALIVIAPEDCEPDAGGGYVVGPAVLAEVSAAFVLYERRVLVLFDEGITLPATFAALPHLTFGRGDLTWDACVALLKVVKEFKRLAAHEREHDDRRAEKQG